MGLITSKRPSEAPPPRRIVRQYVPPSISPQELEAERLRKQIERLRGSSGRARSAAALRERNLVAQLRAERKRADWLERRVAQLVQHCHKYGLKVPPGGKRG